MTAKKIARIGHDGLRDYLDLGGEVRVLSSDKAQERKYHLFGNIFSSKGESLEFYSCVLQQELYFIRHASAHTTTKEGN